MPLGSGSATHAQGPRGRPERNLGDVKQRKADRRAEIERRCLQLDPPIKASTLPYMDAFNNAMQIPMALNDNAWDVLKARLVAQRDDALKKEAEFLTSNKHLQTQAEERREQEEQLRQARTLLERQRDEAQRPVREKLALYADELLQAEWDGGLFVTKDNSPQFAADTLIYVRRKFFEALDQSDEVLDAQALHASLPQGSPDRNLTLEDMKWVYETKIKPITQRHSKEIFLCGACDVDRKQYALDAVIQHYAAKHTDAFSHGSATVYWKADWPEVSPFDPSPIRSPRSRPVDHNGVSPIYQREYSRPQPVDNSFAYPEPFYPIRPGWSMTPDVAPRQMRYAASAYSVDDEIVQPRTRLVPIFSNGDRPANEFSYDAYYVPVSPASPSFPHRAPVQAPYRGNAGLELRQPQPHRFEPPMVITNGFTGHRSVPPAFHSPRVDRQRLMQPGQPSGLQQTQIADLARNAREIWDDTDGVDALPNSVRVYVVIHHVVHRFSEKYTNEPTLTLFTEALQNSSQMKPFAGLDRLTCRSCVSQDKSAVTDDAQQYLLPDLLKHFQTVHIDNVILPITVHAGLEIPRPDWKFDMILLPDERTIRDLIHAEGMTNLKLKLIATILWRYFPQPLPQLGSASTALRPSELTPPVVEIVQSHARQASPSILHESSQYIMQADGDANTPAHSGPRMTEDRREAEELARDDEYDPSRPAPPYPGQEPRYSMQSTQPRMRAGYESISYHQRSEVRGTILPPYLMQAPEHPRHLYGDDTYVRPWTPQRSEMRGYREDRHESSRATHAPPLDHAYRPINDNTRDFDAEKPSERASGSVQLVKLEAPGSVIHDSANATEHFLNNYNVDINETDRHATPNPTPRSDRASDHASSSRADLAPRAVRNFRDRLDGRERPRSGINSHKGTPRETLSTNGASARSRSPSEAPRDVAMPDTAYDARIHENDPYDQRYERRPAAQTRYPDPRPLERPIYSDEMMPRYYEPASRYRTRSPGFSRNVDIRYTQDLPPRGYHNVEEVPYELAGRGYVQAMPQELSQYVERRVVREDFPQYIDQGRDYVTIDTRSGQPLYEAPHPRGHIRYDPYDDRQRYQ